jgi:hypothetical protein
LQLFTQDDDPRRVIEYLQVKLQTDYGVAPTFYAGTLEEALNAAAGHESIQDVRFALYQ